MKSSDIILMLENSFPNRYSERWDNVGLIIGRREREVKRILIALDATQSVIDKAIEYNSDLLITHHPLVFDGIKKITDDDFIGSRIIDLVKNDISCYTLHTNFDMCKMSDIAAEKLGLIETEPLEHIFMLDAESGLGKVGILTEAKSVEECIKLVKKEFNISQVMVYGDKHKTINKIAILPGSGSKKINLAKDKNADLLITGDVDYHTGIDAIEQGMVIIDAGHYGLEKIMIDYMKNFLKENIPDDVIIESVVEDVVSIV